MAEKFSEGPKHFTNVCISEWNWPLTKRIQMSPEALPTPELVPVFSCSMCFLIALCSSTHTLCLVLSLSLSEIPPIFKVLTRSWSAEGFLLLSLENSPGTLITIL